MNPLDNMIQPKPLASTVYSSPAEELLHALTSIRDMAGAKHSRQADVLLAIERVARQALEKWEAGHRPYTAGPMLGELIARKAMADGEIVHHGLWPPERATYKVQTLDELHVLGRVFHSVPPFSAEEQVGAITPR